MLSDNRFRLLTLGRLTLLGGTGEEDASLAKRRRKLALLAVLAMARRPLSRDALVEMFWGEQDEARARHSLSNALSSLRRVLGPNAIRARDTDVALTSEATLSVDALDLPEAVDGREFAAAVELYGGPFLDGFFVDASPAFEQWVTRERRRLEALFLKACAEQCAVLARAERWPQCRALARRWLDAEPLSANAAVHLLNGTKAPGTRAALAQTLDEYEALKTLLERDFELVPDRTVRSLAEGIREQLMSMTSETPVAASQAPASEPSAQVERTTAAPPPIVLPTAPVGLQPAPVAEQRSHFHWNHRMLWSAIGATVVVAVLALFLGARALQGPPSVAESNVARKPVIAVLAMRPRSTDTALAWLADGLPQMIVGKLAHNSEIDVVPPARVHAVLTRSGVGSGPLADDTARDLARRIGATLEARGAIVRDGGSYVLDLTIRDVSSGSLVQNAVLTRADPLALADEAAAHILSAANVSAPGAQMSELETSSLEAYQHFMRSLEAGQAGRAAESRRELDAAIALDSGFIAAVRARITVAIGENDTSLMRRLALTVKRFESRATEFDRLDEEAEAAFYSGEHERSEALARGLLRRYPRDPRAYLRLEGALGYHGKIDEAERVATQALALDSLAVAAGSGPCGPCMTFYSIAALNWARADLRAAAEWSRRWIRMQPDGATAWATLAWTYSYMQLPDSALPLMQRAMSLSGGDLWASEQIARMLIVARRYAAADSAVRMLEAASQSIEHQETAADLRSVLARERGRYRESSQIMKRLVASSPGSTGFGDMVVSDNMRVLGENREAARRYELASHPSVDHFASLPIPSPSARAFCWLHALAADAYAPTGDTITLRAKADTLERGCTRSFYGRDWRLYHHVRGLIAAQGHRNAEAEREFKQAVWSPVEGWSRTTVELANAQAALGRPRDAIATLRGAYATRLDAMGRYVPISEIDYHMALAFAQAGERDSARVYGDYVRAAWRDADPEIRRRLDRLP